MAGDYKTGQPTAVGDRQRAAAGLKLRDLVHTWTQSALGSSVPKTFAPARVYGGWRMVLESLCFRQIWPKHTKAAIVPTRKGRGASRGLPGADTGGETANSAAVSVGTTAEHAAGRWWIEPSNGRGARRAAGLPASSLGKFSRPSDRRNISD
jgi:hypothetical protein